MNQVDSSDLLDIEVFDFGLGDKGKNLLVTGLSSHTTYAHLQAAFSNFGFIREIQLKKNQHTGNLIAFVKFIAKFEARRVLLAQAHHRMEILGRKIFMRLAVREKYSNGMLAPQQCVAIMHYYLGIGAVSVKIEFSNQSPLPQETPTGMLSIKQVCFNLENPFPTTGCFFLFFYLKALTTRGRLMSLWKALLMARMTRMMRTCPRCSALLV
eukprot:m.119605 g.119605  ORF g.119605 m.119605 type:complete len:211 (+) comp12909_c0_seq22:92-724(+)